MSTTSLMNHLHGALLPYEQGVSQEHDRPTVEQDPDNAVIRLREWGTDTLYALPRSPVQHCLIGTSKACDLRLANRNVAPRHALLLCERCQWWIRDLGGNGLRQDGTELAEFALAPGVEICIGGTGGVTLIAESTRGIALRGFCARMLGWGADRMSDLDYALRAIRLAAAHRSVLFLSGEGDLIPIAQTLHRHTLSADAPFVICDPRRKSMPASVRLPANHPSGAVALAAAAGGTLCVRSTSLPPDLPALSTLYRPDASAQIMVCLASKKHSGLLLGSMPIELPSLRGRETEWDTLIDEYVGEACAALAVPTTGPTDDERRWIMQRARTLADIEKAVFRLVTIKHSKSLSKAAARLGMAPVSLSRWWKRRALPPATDA
jgi:hypothetical protein